MNIQNLSIVFSPTMSISHGVLNILFTHISKLFPDTQLVSYVPYAFLRNFSPFFMSVGFTFFFLFFTFSYIKPMEPEKEELSFPDTIEYGVYFFRNSGIASLL